MDKTRFCVVNYYTMSSFFTWVKLCVELLGLLYSENGERKSGVAVYMAVRVAGGDQRVYLRKDRS